MLWYRAHRNHLPAFVFSGDGGLYAAGRWNFKGQKAVYASQNLALATLEWLAHNGLSVSAFSYHRYSIEIPDSDIKWLQANELPSGWDDSPPSDGNRDFATKCLFSEGSPLAVAVPSVMVPEEFNIVINPLHSRYLIAQASIKSLGQFIAPART